MEQIQQRCEAVIEKLKQNGMTGTFVPTAADVRGEVESLLQPGDSIGLGGSVTLNQCGLLDVVRRPEYRLFDRYAPGMTAEQVQQCLRDSLSADVFLSGCNAITEDGVLYNVDGRANRVAALVFGPKRVILVAGYNKIVPDLATAVERVRTVAAPLNAKRLNKRTYCAAEGRCVACGKPMGAGCTSPDRICCDFVVSGAQGRTGRIHVILVGEQLGY